MEGFENRGGEIRRTWYINGTYQDSVQDHKGGPPVRDTGKFVEVCFKPRYSEGQNGDWRPRLPRPGNDAWRRKQLQRRWRIRRLGDQSHRAQATRRMKTGDGTLSARSKGRSTAGRQEGRPALTMKMNIIRNTGFNPSTFT